MARSAHDLDAALDSVPTPVVTLTPAARSVVAGAMAEEPDSARLALWIEVSGVQGTSFAYDLYFQALADAGAGDAVQHDDEVPVVVPGQSVERLQGSRLEWSEEGEGGLVLVNPNTAPAPSLGVPPEVLAAGITGPLAQKVAAVLDQEVNPSIAGHGGRADLVALDEGTGIAYLRLSGGCQGCAMSRMTLTQGIEVALRDGVPEITGVVDVTDHAGGDNPYF